MLTSITFFLQYGVVFDAGSSHTSAFVYKWPGNKRSRGTAVPVDEIYDATEDKGIRQILCALKICKK